VAGYIRKRGVRQDGSTKWQARYWDAADRTRRYEKVFRTKGEAQRWLTVQGARQIHGDHVDPRGGDRPYREIVEAWRSTWLNLSPKTRSGYEQILRTHLMPEFGARRASTITPALVQRYVARLQGEGVAPGTIKNIYSALRGSLSTAVRLRLLTVNPCVGVRLPEVPHEEMLSLDAEEVRTLAETIDPRYRTLIYVAAYTGLRAGELLALRRLDVDLLHSKLHVRRALKDVNGAALAPEHKGMIFGPTKNRTSRTVSLPRFLRDMLAEHLSSSLPSGSGPDALVFASPNGLPMRHSLWYRRTFKPAVRRALPPHLHPLRFHDLRHSAASLLIAAGVHPKAISERLGHADIRITMNRYGHLLPSVDAALTDALDLAHAASLTPTREVSALHGKS